MLSPVKPDSFLNITVHIAHNYSSRTTHFRNQIYFYSVATRDADLQDSLTVKDADLFGLLQDSLTVKEPPHFREHKMTQPPSHSHTEAL
jgi:hypothetical protein